MFTVVSTAVPDRAPARFDTRQALRTWAPTLLTNVGLTLATYLVATAAGAPPVVALALGAVWPLARAAVTAIVRRHVDELSILALLALAVGVAAALAVHDVRILVVRNAATTALLGLVMLGSLVLRRPLIFYFGRRFATDGTPEGAARWDSYERYPSFRRANRVVTAVWGVGLLGEAVVRVVVGLWAPVVVALVVGHVLPYVVIAGLITATTVYGRRVRRAATAGGGEPRPV